MPRRKAGGAGSVPAVVTSHIGPVAVTMNGGSEPVQVDAMFRVPKVHRSEPGPGSAERDKIAWTDPATSYPCIIRRSIAGSYSGHDLTHHLITIMASAREASITPLGDVDVA